MEEPRLSRIPTLSAYDIETPQSNLFDYTHNNSTDTLDIEYNNRRPNIILNTQYFGCGLCFIIFFGIISYIIYEYTTHKNYYI